ncbi:hypothetical protein N9B21_01215 [Verrucomicrobiales bacterium]|nr:hypothetical protein [Verrucomicrobiales bacterium]MDA7926638.1 hypothetical protein [Verrucomicrobiales bacterium]
MKKAVLIFLAGLLFGAGLALSGMTDPSRVVGFLDLAGQWDPTLAFVMGGALIVFSAGYFLLRKKCHLPGNESDPVSKKLIFGAILFGIGWGLGGFCPGPAIANLAAPRIEALIFVPMMAVGMFLAQRICGVDR